jgi:hydrogenase nickel incorporation protein HypA/HybF
MHETGLIRDLVHRLEAAAHEAGAERVTSVTVWLGALSQMSAEHFHEHFIEEVRGTVAEGAVLRLDVSNDVRHHEAQSVVLQSVDLEV